MASASNWGSGKQCESYDEFIEDYYELYNRDNVPPGMLYLSYTSMNVEPPGPAPGADPYFYFAEFYRRVLREGLAGRDAASIRGRVLVLGCGLGGAGKVLAEELPNASQIVCVDLVEHQIAVAQERLGYLSPRVVFEVGDITALTYTDQSFDLVFDEVALSHLRGEYINKLPDAMSELRRVVAPGGLVVLSGYTRPWEIEAMLTTMRRFQFHDSRRLDISNANGEGAKAAMKHMFGPGVVRRGLVLANICYNDLRTSYVTNIPEMRALLGDHFRMAPTLMCPVAFARLVAGAAAYTRAKGRHPQVYDMGALEAKIAEEECNAPSPALPANLTETHGMVLEALVCGICSCFSRGGVIMDESYMYTHDKERYKPCWVLTLEPIEGASLRASPSCQGLVSRTVPISLSGFVSGTWYRTWALLGSCLNSVGTLAVLALLRTGRVTRAVRSRYSLHFSCVRGDNGKLLEVGLGDLDSVQFQQCCLQQRRPLLARGVVAHWPALWKWTPSFLASLFGDLVVKVQGEGYKRVAKLPLRSFLAEVFDSSVEVAASSEPHTTIVAKGTPSLRYSLPRDWFAETLRTFGCFGMLDVIYGPAFTSAAFLKLRDDWCPPSFLPVRGYTLPFTFFRPEGPRERFFYDFGVYIAPKGAVTRLHVDGTTNAVLMLVSGEKRFVLVPPAAAKWFVNASEAPSDEPLFEKSWAALTPTEKTRMGFEPICFSARAGDLVFVPRGWAHEVYTTEPSVMVTYNFLHGWKDLAQGLAESVCEGYGGARMFRPGGAEFPTKR